MHGVASGDALSDRVIVWTKVTPPPDTPSFYVRYDVSLSAEDPDISLPGSPLTRLGPSIFSGTVLTGPEVDYTVKIDLLGLDPKTVYYFQFSVPSNIADYNAGKPHSLVFSPAGRTQTLPAQDDASISSVQFAVVSCSNWPRGFFNVYSSIAARPEIDVVLHLGDYIYEYRNGEYGDGASIGRIPLPDKELLTLEDYRARHAQYKEDEDLQALHRLKPWIVIWDDHEFVDDISGFASSFHQHSNETMSRIPSAMRAYFEYLPIRAQKTFTYTPTHLSVQKTNNQEGDQNLLLLSKTERHVQQQQERSGIYRNFHFGTLLDLMMLDTRIHGRDKSDWSTLQDEGRTILGDDQEQWLVDQLQGSMDRGASWRIIGNQVVFAQMDYWGLMFNGDAWDGYPASRKRILEAIEERKLKDIVVLTGDVHSSFSFNVPKSLDSYNPKTGEGSLLVEFVAPAVTSPSPLESIHVGFLNPLAEMLFPRIEPHLHFMDLSRRGYMILKVGVERTVCEYWYTKNVRVRNSGESLGAIVETEKNSGRITRVTTMP
ncbi:putative alkaline phosphatase [Obelidium mucronatum]|nr:putative alkaline phosphatase [Obelidium mucronatum]